MKKLLLTTLIALSFSANAQYMGTVPPNADARFFYSQDTDKFKAATAWIGAAHSSGFGARVGYSHYTGPQNLSTMETYYENSSGYSYNGPQVINNDFSSSSTFLQLTYVNIGENHDFQGAIGFRNSDYKTDTSKTRAAQSKILDDFVQINGVPDAALSYVAKAANALSSDDNLSGSRTTLVGDAELKLRMTDSLTIGMTVATDTVESVRAIQTGTQFVYTAVDMDLLLDENLNLNVIAGNVYYTDDNNRPFIRTKLTWTFMPEYGLSTYLRTRNQTDTNPGSQNYYSPETLAQQAIGLQIRKPYNGLVYTAGVEYGSEQATSYSRVFDTTSSSRNPIYSWTLGVQTNPGRKTGTTFGISLIGSNTSITGGGGSNYDWYGLNSWIKVPLQ